MMRATAVMGLALILSGCGASQPAEDVDAFLARVAAMPAPKLVPVPEPAPYEPFAYSAFRLRSPFVPARGTVPWGGRKGPPRPPMPPVPGPIWNAFPFRNFVTWGNGKAGPGAMRWCGMERGGFTAYPSGPT